MFFTPKVWEKKKKTQKTTLAAQLLQNPAAGNEATFRMEWLRGYQIRPGVLNVYIMGDPSTGKKRKNTDRCAIAVVGVDVHLNKYLLDGACHRMPLSERWAMLKMLRKKWIGVPGVQSVKCGWERYGQETDLDYFEEKMRETKESFDLEELNWTRDGNESKEDRVERLQPDFMAGDFWVPGVAWHEVHGDTYWTPNLKTNKIDYVPMLGPSNQMKVMIHQQQPYRCAKSIKRQDEDGNVYDLTRRFFEEYLFFPFGSKDDLVDATSRIYDMEPLPPVVFENDGIVEEHFID